MITSLKAFTKSAGLIAGTLKTKENSNNIPVLPTSTHPNFGGSTKKKRWQSWKRNSSCISCYCTPEKGMLQGSMYRRQILLASTSFAFKPQEMMAAMPPPPDFTDYHKLASAVQESKKFKNSPHGADELSGVAAAPLRQQLLPEINEKEVVTAWVRRPAAVKRTKDKEEQLVLEGIEVTNEKPLCFHVYIKLGLEGDDDEEEIYAGTFSHVPPRGKQRACHNNKQDFDGRQEQKGARRCCLRLGMNDMLRHRGESVVIVKLVPTLKHDDDPIKVASIFIDST